MGDIVVALSFNALGYEFRNGLRIIENSFRASEAALLDEIERAMDDAFAHQQSQEQGAAWIGERDDDGYILWDQQTLLDFRVEDARAALREIRNAFAIVIYHHWERSALRWTGLTKGNHDTILKKSMALGYPVHEHLERTRLLINTLKHDSSRDAPTLFEKANQYFRDGFIGTSNLETWQDAIALSTEHILELIEIVRASGPDEHMLPTQSQAPVPPGSLEITL